MQKNRDVDTYQAYLLRFWRRDASMAWRVTLHDVATKEDFHFADVTEAMTFLQERPELGKTILLSAANPSSVAP